MIVRKPTKIVLKLEDDIAEYEEAKSKALGKKNIRAGAKFTPNAFVTPNSIKLDSESMMGEGDSNGFRDDQAGTLDHIRSNPLFGPSSEDNVQRPSDYINSLLHNIIHGSEEHSDESPD